VSVEKDMKSIIQTVFGFALLAIAVLGGRWALMPLIRPPQGLSSGSETDLIRNRYPHRLVDPLTLNMSDEEIGRKWVLVEAKERAFVALSGLAVFGLTGAGVLLLFRERKSATGEGLGRVRQ
jgi:hypothetical protein